MFQLLFLIVFVFIIYKFKRLISKCIAKCKDGGRKVTIKIKPGFYRDYSPTIRLTECVHYEVLDNLGICSAVVIKNYKQFKSIVNDINDVGMSVDDFCRVAAEKIESSKDFSEKTIYTVFLSELGKTYPDKAIKMTVEDIVKAIEFAFGN